MLHFCLFALLISSSDLGPAPKPTFADPPRPIRASDPPSRWDGAGRQLAAGVGGGALGSSVGGLVGVAIAQTMVSDGDGWNGLGTLIFGGLVGAGLGGTTATAFSVKLTSSEAYPSRSAIPAWVGSVLGTIGGVVLVGQVAKHSPEDIEWGLLPGFATIVTCSGVGAVLLDRAVANPRSVSIAPWTPDGRAGAVAVAAF